MKLIALCFLLYSQILQASEGNTQTSKFEWGGGLLGVFGNDYRGSDQGRFWFFPIPYFTYASQKLEAEPSFIRGIIFHNDWISFKLSFVLGLNVESKGNRARIGMPGLDYTFELGPMPIFHLWQSSNLNLAINLECPVRESFATDLTYIKPVGLFSIPYLNIIHHPNSGEGSWNSEFSLGPMYADKKYHQRFYEVEKEFVRADRAFYEASGGYSGLQTAIVLNKRFQNLLMISFVRWDYLKGAVFESSPLVKTKNYFVGGLGLFWMVD
jgi:outer membrane scaffolding protein for murein synthesis (MipA/OmpV family)